MKRRMALILSILLILALFAGCGGTGTTPTAAPATQAPADQSTQAPETAAPATAKPTDAPQATAAPEPTPEPEPESPYKLAAGKYAVNEAGFPTEKYVYDQPFCTDDTVFTEWTTCYTPQYIPEGGWAEVPTWKGLAEMTGVHIEYDLVDSANRSQNFSVRLASDELDDILMQASSFYKAGTLKSAVEDGYFANLYDYREYMPCYMYEIYNRSQNNRDVMGRVFYDKTTIVSLTGLQYYYTPAMGYFLRQDWLDRLGMGKAEDVQTYDELHEVLTAMKSNFSEPGKEVYPYFINSNVESYQGATTCGYNTTVYTTSMNFRRVVNDKVEFCGTTEDDRAAMNMLSTWYAEGLISPQFHTFVSGEDYESGSHNDTLGCNLMPPNTWVEAERAGLDPNTDWEPMPRTKLYRGQILQYANPRKDFHYGSVCLNAKCENLPLALSWLDFWISDAGFEWTNWGPEGLLWEYNDQGEKRLSDFAIHNEAGLAWITAIYGCNPLGEFCMLDNLRSYYYDDGARAMTAFPVFTVSDYGGEYDWPSGVKLTDEESDETVSIFADLNTYFEEHYVLFVDGSVPMSDWDAFQESLRSFGFDRVEEIYQDAYDRYKAEEL